MSTLYINGEWLEAEKSQESINPVDESVVGVSSLATEDMVDSAVQAANDAFKSWRKYPLTKRAEYIKQIIEKLTEKKEELAQMMTLEMGKTLAESRGEAGVVLSYAEYILGEANREQGALLPSADPNRTIEVVREPVGVVGCITPWNFPVVLAAYKIFSSLIAGNTLVWKPASEVALSAKIFTEAVAETDLPAGVFNLVTGSGRLIGNRLVEHEDVAIIAFTGSTEVGKNIARLGSETLKRVSLELGGKNAVIVLKDADLEKAATEIVRSSFITSGQRCTAASRVIYEAEIEADLLEKIIDKTRALKIGNGLDQAVDMGPLVNQSQLETVEHYVKTAILEGAVLETGGSRLGETGFFFEPTVMSKVDPSSTLAKEEVFGPVLAMIRAESLEEAIEINNNTIYGLSTSVFTESLTAAKIVSREAETGLVYVNSGTSNAEIGVAFGGKKMSGNGHREVASQSFDLMTEWKSIYTTY